MNLFKPKGLGQSVKCSRCGTTFYEIADNSAIVSLRKKYYPTFVVRCADCGKHVCEYCMLRGCPCGGTRMITLNVMKKMR